METMEAMYKKFLRRLSRARKHDDCYKKFSILQMDEQRVKFLLHLLEKFRIHPDVRTESRKFASMSSNFQCEANELYNIPQTELQFQFDSVIEAYTKSAAYAPPESDELSLAYANRSAVLFYAKLYDHCLQDIERALKINNRDDVRETLLSRRAQCLIALNPSTPSVSKKNLEAICRYLGKMNLNDTKKRRAESIVNCFKSMLLIERPKIMLDFKKPYPKIQDPQCNLFPHCLDGSSIFKIAISEDYGRHMVAASDIRADEFLIINEEDNPTLNIDSRYGHCWRCSKQTWSGIPCDYCVEVIYCSEACKYVAWNEYHDVECNVIGPLLALEFNDLDISALRLTVRAVKQAGSLQALKDELEAIDSSTTDLTTEDEKKYASVYTLERDNGEEMKVDELLKLTFESTILLYILVTRSNMFDEDYSGDLNALKKDQWVTFIGGLILRNKQIIKTNCYQMSTVSKKMYKTRRAARPLKSLLHFFNCNNNFTITKSPKRRTVWNNNFINEGEPLFGCYGPLHIRTVKNARQNTFEGYHRFVCDCVAYNEDLFEIPGLPSFLVQNVPELTMSKVTVRLKDIRKQLDIDCGKISNSIEMEVKQDSVVQWMLAGTWRISRTGDRLIL